MADRNPYVIADLLKELADLPLVVDGDEVYIEVDRLGETGHWWSDRRQHTSFLGRKPVLAELLRPHRSLWKDANGA